MSTLRSHVGGHVSAMDEAVYRAAQLRARGINAILRIRPRKDSPHRYEVIVVEGEIMSKKGYKKKTIYQFEVADETWEVLAFDKDTIEFEETRKNGQEDTHIYGIGYHSENGWKLDEDTRKVLSMYRNDETAPAIEAFFDKHGMPAKHAVPA